MNVADCSNATMGACARDVRRGRLAICTFTFHRHHPKHMRGTAATKLQLMPPLSRIRARRLVVQQLVAVAPRSLQLKRSGTGQRNTCTFGHSS